MNDHDPRTAADLNEAPVPAPASDDTRMALGAPTEPIPGEAPAATQTAQLDAREDARLDQDASPPLEPFFDDELPTGTRWRWYHVAPGFAPLLVLLVLLIAGVPQRVLGRLHGADPHEPNDVVAAAIPIEPGTYPDLTCRHGDVDWYRLTVPAGKALKVSANPGPEGNGAISVHTPRGETLRSGTTDCTWMPPDLQQSEAFIRVWGGRLGRYTLKVDLIDPRTRFEQNDTRRNATPVEPGTLTAIRCDGRDWFVVEVPRWRGLKASLRGAAGLGLHLLDGTRDTADGVKGALPTEASLDARILPRRVYVEVVGQGDYALTLALGPRDDALMAKTGEAPLPISRDRLEPNQSPDAAATLKPGHYTDLRVDGVDYYRVRVPADTTLQVALTPKQRWGGLNVPTASLSPLGRGLGLRQTRLGNGAVHLLAHQDKPATVTFSLRGTSQYSMKVRLRPGAPGTLVPPGEYPNLEGTGDDVWRIDLQAGQAVVTEVMTRRFDEQDYGSTLSMEILGKGRGAGTPPPQRPLGRRRGRRIRRVRRKNRRLSTAVHGIGTLRYQALQKESIVLRVSGQPQRYDLTVKLEGAGRVFRPTRARTVVAGTLSRRVLPADSEAFYRLDLKRDQVLVGSVVFDNAKADLDLELLDATGMRLGRSAGTDTDEERIRFVADRDRRVYLRVASTGLKPTRYDLTISRDGRTRPPTIRLPLGKRRFTCSGSDHYRIRVAAGERLRVQAAFKHTEGDLDLAFLDGNGNELARSATNKNIEALSRTAKNSEEVLVRVDGATNAYELTAILEAP